MSHISGATHAHALSQIEKVSSTLAEALGHAVRGLDELGVRPMARSGITLSTPPMPDPTAIGVERGLYRAALTQTLSKTAEKGTAIVTLIGDGAFAVELGRQFSDRAGGLDEKALKTLKGQLHFSGVSVLFSSQTPGDRLTIRTAISLAFAQGASLIETAKLRTLLVEADETRRDEALAGLSRPGANLEAVVARLTRPTTTSPEAASPSLTRGTAKATARALPMPLGEDEATELRTYLKQVDQTEAILADDMADTFISSNRDTLGLRDASPTTRSCVQAEFAAVAAYTATSFYSQVNQELRREAKTGEQPCDGVALMTKAATMALSRLEDFRGIVVRGGGSGWLSQARQLYTIGATVTEPTFLSSSVDKGFGGEVQFIIESLHGKEITNVSNGPPTDGREILFAPGSRFNVLDKAEENGVLFIIMKEVD